MIDGPMAIVDSSMALVDGSMVMVAALLSKNVALLGSTESNALMGQKLRLQVTEVGRKWTQHANAMNNSPADNVRWRIR